MLLEGFLNGQKPVNTKGWLKKKNSHQEYWATDQDVDENSMMIYKYRAINQRTFEILINKKIYFSAPIDLNDPLDCSIDIEAEYQKVVGKYNPDISEEYNRKAFLLYLLNNHHKDKDDNYVKLNVLIGDFIKTLGVFSASKNERDALLWSHYGDSHKGICLGFDESIMPDEDVFMSGGIKYKGAPAYQDIFESLIEELGTFVQPWNSKPNYPAEMGDKFYTKQLYVLMEGNLMIKSSKWEYEEEYRIVRNKHGLFSFNPEALKCIVFGVRTSEVDKETIRNILCLPEYQHVEIKKAIIVPGSFDFAIESE
ncbi:DUF2971 domain-containing protein [Pectobacterium brasiliense]|uniref:DUF2971 domain-containing protein n=1 Tax=Pectobacterium brasiliense TaxID=180957 RepID=UPI0011B030FC|nr:DUF2971 domain-containing protein [Pectobacterium brasiliense]MBN3099422.1 DUF2971 domain-containing protein [Pectobacterium brasiliense]MBN3102770.1 DUF2971 domain-containing protein [Pectobacterium brasiliense]MBN3165219.1 DUF2971 domain-containing protein [Pectobacterium brasiliense]MBN3182546.1 DUF2971 domain-containing protein [Pectobacterium brasiliense]